ncbi:hypothetical protein B566_EDAN017157 [Ephemera danica]|nr:hypothetical protein B566_EDAN017157 [Ephemera danica]
MRYLINDTYWNKDSGPILFYTGNEGDIKMFAENTGFMCRDIAPEMKAMIIFAEHRFYGESMPFGNTSYSLVPGVVTGGQFPGFSANKSSGAFENKDTGDLK